jgi:hypothetical protein
MSSVKRAVRGEANAFGRNSMTTHRRCRDKTQEQSPETTLMVDQVPLICSAIIKVMAHDDRSTCRETRAIGSGFWSLVLAFDH